MKISATWYLNLKIYITLCCRVGPKNNQNGWQKQCRAQPFLEVSLSFFYNQFMTKLSYFIAEHLVLVIWNMLTWCQQPPVINEHRSILASRAEPPFKDWVVGRTGLEIQWRVKDFSGIYKVLVFFQAWWEWHVKALITKWASQTHSCTSKSNALFVSIWLLYDPFPAVTCNIQVSAVVFFFVMLAVAACMW